MKAAYRGVFAPPLLQQRSDTPCPMLTSSSCFNQGSFADPLTEVLRNGARALLAQAIEAEVAEFLAKHVDLKTATGLSRGPAPKLRGCRSGVNESGSQETCRWRETDSNPRSPVEESPFVETVFSRFLPPLRFRGGRSVLTNCSRAEAPFYFRDARDPRPPCGGAGEKRLCSGSPRTRLNGSDFDEVRHSQPVVGVRSRRGRRV